MFWNRRVIQTVGCGPIKVCTILPRKFSSWNQTSLATYSLVWVDFIWKRLCWPVLVHIFETSGIFAVLVETVLWCWCHQDGISGSHYSRARTAHSIMHEVLTSMMLEAFFSKFPERWMELESLQVDFLSKELTSKEWWRNMLTTSKQPFKFTSRKGHHYPSHFFIGTIMFPQ